MKPQIVNIINFIRGVEPRDPQLNILEPVVKQIELLKKHELPGTFLIQYDAMISNKFSDLLISELDEKYEIGGWFEIMKPLAEKAGIAWRGREGYDWDWHANAGFSVAYTPDERERLVDVFMKDFQRIFGYYPESMGAWIIDAHTLSYMADKYGIKASCICRDQWGTDGYNLWGGYYNQAYYPSRMNVFTPAQTLEKQIPIPVFRMLGSDPIYQYDAGLMEEKLVNGQPVITLEPVYPEAGGSPQWVRWYFKENFNGICLSFGYTQVGQENSFGWEAMAKGLTDQMELVKLKSDAGELKVETLKDTGKWYKSQYCLTAASALAALSDWKNQGCRSIWYSSRFYRMNVLMEAKLLRIRDIHFFDELYEERYLSEVNTEESLIYDNLPVMDGYRWSSCFTKAGICPVRLLEDGHAGYLSFGEPSVSENEGDELSVVCPMEEGGCLKITCKAAGIEISCDFAAESIRWGMQLSWSEDKHIPITGFDEKNIFYEYEKFRYKLSLDIGRISVIKGDNSILLLPDGERLLLRKGDQSHM